MTLCVCVCVYTGRGNSRGKCIPTNLPRDTLLSSTPPVDDRWTLFKYYTVTVYTVHHMQSERFYMYMYTHMYVCSLSTRDFYRERERENAVLQRHMYVLYIHVMKILL